MPPMPTTSCASWRCRIRSCSARTAQLAIWIDTDAAAGTLTIRDNGIGMSREEAISHLGTIAKSGTAEFFKRLTGDQQKDAQLIGQFGVGFYSAFIVAERVEVLTRRADAEPDAAVRWESSADGQFTVETVDARRARHQRGAAPEGGCARNSSTRSGCARWCAATPITSPFRCACARRVPPRSITRTSTRRRRCGPGRAARSRTRNTAISTATSPTTATDPLAWSHNRVEGKREYTSLLYLPARAPFDLWQREAARGLKLYVRRVFIMDNAEQFLPLYLRFIKGVIDSSDLPLNVSRELLQQDREVEAMRGAAHAPRARAAGASSPRTSRRSTASSGASSAACSRKGSARIRPTASGCCRCCASPAPPAPTDDESVSLADYVARMQSGPGAHLLRDRRQPGGGAREPAPGAAAAEGRGGAAAGRSRR